MAEHGLPVARIRKEVTTSRASAPKVPTAGLHLIQREATPSDTRELLISKGQEFSSSQVPDLFKDSYNKALGGTEDGLVIIEPPYPLDSLAKIAVDDVTLASCIQSIVTNTTRFGYTLEYIGPEKQQESKEAKLEKTWITDLLDNCNADESLLDVLSKAQQDYETFGFAFLEVGRDISNNIDFVYHIPAQSMRPTTAELVPVETEVWLRREGQLKSKVTYKRFRRFVQVRSSDNTKTYFKEFGDPRAISAKTGKVEELIAVADEAVEVIWINRYSPGFIFGLPKFASCVPAIIGSREAALTNLDFFENNTIPALAVLVSGGMLTEETILSIRNQFNRSKGKAMVNKALILEARPVQEDMPVEGITAPPTPRIDIKPLAQDRQSDALFQEYMGSNSEQVRQSFRLPPLLVGLATDYNRATAESSLEMAEAQVFGPERSRLDGMVNSKLLLRQNKPPTFWRYRSNSPKLASPEALAKAIEQLDKVGAMTPNTAITLANTVFGLRLAPIKEAWGDLPFYFSQELIKGGKVKPETGLKEVEEPKEQVVKPKPGTGGKEPIDPNAAK